MGGHTALKRMLEDAIGPKKRNGRNVLQHYDATYISPKGLGEKVSIQQERVQNTGRNVVYSMCSFSKYPLRWSSGRENL